MSYTSKPVAVRCTLCPAVFMAPDTAQPGACDRCFAVLWRAFWATVPGGPPAAK